MLALTRKTDYALVALSHLARQGGALVSARDLAERFRLPLSLLMNILNQLTRNGLVASTRGAKGGYRLGRPADQITLAQLIDAIESPLRLTLCCPTDGDVADQRECDLQDVCPVQEPIQRVHLGLRQFLDEVTLASLTSEAVPIGLDLHTKDKQDRPDRAGDETVAAAAMQSAPALATEDH